MNIEIVTVPHDQQRYDTLGDWVFSRSGLCIAVSDTGSWQMNLLIGLHELIEASLCSVRGIDEPDVLAFDLAHGDHLDPGSLREAPYHDEHVFAESIERLVAAELGVDWEEYSARCEGLSR